MFQNRSHFDTFASALRVVTLALLSICCVITATGQPIVVQSTFDASVEGWTVRGFTSALTCSPLSGGTALTNLSWQSAGGVPGGFLRHPEAGNTGDSYFRAPSAFRGDLSTAYAGLLTIDRRFTSVDADGFEAKNDIQLLGGGFALFADVPVPSRELWGRFSVPLLPGHWNVGSCDGPPATEAQLRAVLGNVTDLFIRAEYVAGNETHDLDNVTITAGAPLAGRTASWSLLDNDVPTGRWNHAVAVDTDRNVLVLFGGNTGESDTWEYNLLHGVWTLRTPSISPSRRGGHAMLYDRARQRTVMTGGNYNGTVFNEVWEYDGVTGSWALSDPLPQARSGHAMAYDLARDTIVLYGGLASGAPGAIDVLERDAVSSQWVTRSSVNNPQAQIGYAMAYDAARNVCVLIGGGTTSALVAEWDGITGTWDIRSIPGAAPATRLNPGVAYDTARSRIVLAGGEAFRDTWDYDGSVWMQRANMAPSGQGRDDHALVYDHVNNVVLLSGGLLGNSNPQRDLRAFDGASNSWSTVWSKSSLSPRVFAPIAFDEIGGQAIVAGGRLVDRPGFVSQFGAAAHLFDGFAWTVPPATGAQPVIHDAPLVYDALRRVMIRYGGKSADANTSTSQEVWSLDPATLTWTNRTLQPSSPPGQRFRHAAAYDRARDQIVYHGGVNQSNVVLSDTWVYTPSTNQWMNVTPLGPTPGQRSGAGMAYDEHRGRIVLFGGVVGPAGAETFDNSTWEWDGTAWVDVTPEFGNPPTRGRHSLVYDSDRKTVVLFGGNNYFGHLPGFTDIWEFNGANWTQLFPLPGPNPIARRFSAVTYDTTTGRHLHIGGVSVTVANEENLYNNGQTWALTFVCPPDLTTTAIPGSPGYGVPNGTLNNDDFFYFLAAFASGNIAVADLTTTAVAGSPGYGVPNGVLNNDDFFYYLTLFAAGC